MTDKDNNKGITDLFGSSRNNAAGPLIGEILERKFLRFTHFRIVPLDQVDPPSNRLTIHGFTACTQSSSGGYFGDE